MEQAAVARVETGIRVSDVSGQKHFKVPVIPKESTVGEFIQGLLDKLGLPRNNGDGQPITYRARLEREGRHLGPGELVGDAFEEDDAISLHPNVDAGSC